MSASTAPDVDRVLTRMGRSAFGYRSFPDRVEELAGIAAVSTLPTPEPEAPPASDAPPAGAASGSPGAGGGSHDLGPSGGSLAYPSRVRQ